MCQVHFQSERGAAQARKSLRRNKAPYGDLMTPFTESTPFQPDVDITALALVGGPAPCCAKNPNGKLQNSNSDIWGQGALASAHHSNPATCQPLPIQPSFPKSRLNWPEFCHQCCYGFLLNIFGKIHQSLYHSI